MHYWQLGRPSSLEQGEPLLASTGPETRQSRMEVDSLEQDKTLRDYWKKKEKKKEEEGKKERKRKEVKRGNGANRVTGTDQERLDDKSSESRNPLILPASYPLPLLMEEQIIKNKSTHQNKSQRPKRNQTLVLILVLG